MKFKVGDRVKAVDNIGLFPNGALGTVIEVDPGKTRQGYFVHFDGGNELWCWTSKTEAAPVAAPVGSPKIVITDDGKTTLARLYEGNKVVRSAEAKCSPSDTFSFQTGAELAFKRLFETAKPVTETQGKPGPSNKYEVQKKPEPPKVDKPKYSKGDKVKILRDRTECGYYHAYAKGEIATFLYEVDDTKAELSGRCSNTGEPCMQTVHYDDFVPYTEPKEEPKPEPVKLYCAKSLVGWLTNGKVYESVNGHVVIDDGREFADIIMRTRGYLYPLVKRPAIAGEWVYCTVDFGGFTKAGTIYNVVSVTDSGVVEFHDPAEFWECTNRLTTSAYLVLDGYHPEEKKPELYNGKVVCVDDGGIRMKGAWTVGKVYTFKDGFAYQDNGVKVPCFESPITSVDDLNAKCAVRSSIRFIEYKGEA